MPVRNHPLINSFVGRAYNIWKIDTVAGDQKIKAMVPLAEMFGYVMALRGRTQGQGNFTMQFDHYAEVPAKIAETIK